MPSEARALSRAGAISATSASGLAHAAVRSGSAELLPTAFTKLAFLLLFAKSRRVLIRRGVPEQIDRAEQRGGASRREKPNLSPLGFLLDQPRFMESSRVLGGGRNLHPALDRHFLNAEISSGLEQSDHFDPAMICQPAGQLCPTTVIVCHRLQILAPFYFLPKVKTCPLTKL